MTVVIIEDEPLAATQLKQYITGNNTGVHIAAHLRSIQECIAWFNQNPHPDVIFSDIELLDGNVFSFFDTAHIKCPVVFTTAYDQFLLKAFDGNGIAYLLKPFTQQQVEKSVQKIQQLQSSTAGVSAVVLQQLQQALLQQQEQQTYKQRFTVKLRAGIFLLAATDIAFIQADGALVHAFDKSGKKYPLTGTLNAIEEQLNPAIFFRINRSDMVNIASIEKMETYSGDRLALYVIGQKNIAITSTQRTPDFRKWADK